MKNIIFSPNFRTWCQVIISKMPLFSSFCFVVIFGLLAFFSNNASGKDTYLLSTIEYPPLFQEKEIPGKGFGIALDLTTEAFKAVGKEVKYKIIPMKRCILMEKKYIANVGAINWFKNANMMDKVLYVNVTHSKFVLFYKKNKFPNDITFSKLEDLKQFGNIGNVRGSSTTKLVENAGLSIDWASSLELNFKKLHNDRFDLAISIQLAGWATLMHLYPSAIEQYSCSSKAILEIPISITFLKENKTIYDEFIKGIRMIAANGKFMEILEKYYGKEKIPEEVLKILKEHQS